MINPVYTSTAYFIWLALRAKYIVVLDFAQIASLYSTGEPKRAACKLFLSPLEAKLCGLLLGVDHWNGLDDPRVIEFYHCELRSGRSYM